MRAYLFRGKIKGSGEWVEGNLLNVKWWLDGSPITVIVPTDAYLDPRSGQGTIRYIEVIPETVGEYTRANDKNGTKIFEGDIVKCCGEIRTVVFDERFLEFEFSRYDRVDNPDGLALCGDYIQCEVIGNIHDNPELLKGE